MSDIKVSVILCDPVSHATLAKHTICVLKCANVRSQCACSELPPQADAAHLSGEGCTSGSSTEDCRLSTSSSTSTETLSFSLVTSSVTSPVPAVLAIVTATLQGSSTRPVTLCLWTWATKRC